MKVSVIIPVYNEFHYVDEVVRRVEGAPLPVGMEREMIIVDDGSTDGTTQLLKKYTSRQHIIICSSEHNHGKGVAIRMGLDRATGDIILIQDADLEYSPEDYPALLQPITDGRAEVVYGSRFLTAVRVPGMRFSNWVANMLLRTTVNLLYGAHITDEATAYKVFRASVIKEIPLECRRFEFCPEVTAKCLKRGYRIHEVPIRYTPRGKGAGKKIRWYDGVIALWTLLKYRVSD